MDQGWSRVIDLGVNLSSVKAVTSFTPSPWERSRYEKMKKVPKVLSVCNILQALTNKIEMLYP